MTKRIFEITFEVVTFLLMFAAIYAIFIYAPIEKTMGIVQKIFYLHVPAAFLAFSAFFITFLASIVYLYKKDQKWDVIAYCSAEVGVLFCTIVLITGPIWAKPVWNVWWTWDPRLTTTLILGLGSPQSVIKSGRHRKKNNQHGHGNFRPHAITQPKNEQRC